ncbi:hypothetical protein PANO111632_17870 [Paracoccus nototheniae]|uniref:Regulator RcnB of Ni and Co efflux n=1 Tax=Paracoccus nototheniae TaxID=2489002 RepID=A0ABW4E1D2_9RHOB|nr:hypothetical protein [Paracoccus nototheniae]
MTSLTIRLASLGLALAIATPVLADPGRGNGNGHGNGHGKNARHEQRDDRRHARTDDRYRDCPPGLARKNPPCVPPGQARGHGDGYGHRIGDRLRAGDYILVRDTQRHNLPTRPDWRYYRDDNQIYRVDSNTQRILAVINLINAFSN